MKCRSNADYRFKSDHPYILPVSFKTFLVIAESLVFLVTDIITDSLNETYPTGIGLTKTKYE